MDSLLQDLGLPYWRKGNIFAELFSPYMGPDYRGVVQEWLRANRGEQRAAANGGEVKAVVDVEREPLLKVNGKAH
jgi:hypothetical protein